MFEPLSVLRHLAQHRLLNRERDGNPAQRLDADPRNPGSAVGPDDVPTAPSRGDLVLLWTVSGLTNKVGM
jgi:hypothetical protein